ncbi:MAG: protein kinase, partial [Gemmatimonadaceae bacterium]
MTELRERLQAALGEAYKVGEELTGGGMSRVFVADDLELDRKVVVKLLPPDLAAGLNVERFRREIQLAARLQHPHIVPLLHAGAKDGLLYYTMPYISGESLRGRLARSGELPIGNAVRILIEVADALECAHADGVVHRDVKPENILLARHHALVTDFGVSKALSSATGESNLTSLGVALGTPAYMSPEQAAADPNVDHRTDIYALGVLAYELLTGRPPFTGATPQQVLAAQVTEAPQHISVARPSIPAPLAAVIMRCLEKRPADRWQSAEELRVQLELAASPSGSNQPVSGVLPPASAQRGASSRKYLFAGAAAGVLILALLASTYLRSDVKAFALEETRQLTNDPGGEVMPALSPDGRLLAYFSEQADGIVVRQVSGGKPVNIASGNQPTWSPNGSEIAFARDDGIYVIPALGGTARRVITDAEWPAWSPDGKALAYVTYDGWVSVADVDGRNARKLHRASQPHLFSWSPDGSRLAFVSENSEWMTTGNIAPSSIVVLDIDVKEAAVVTTDTHLNTSPRWSADGSGIFYVSSVGGGRDIYFRRIARDGKPTGDAQRLTTGLALHSITSSADGSVMAYSTATATVGIWTVPIPAAGTVSVGAARQLTFVNERIEAMSISRDGTWLAFDSDRAGNQDIWKMPLAGGDAEQLTRDPADDFNPSWSPDGKEISFHSWRSGNRDAYLMSADGSNERLLLGGPSHEFGGRWSPDGKSLALVSDRSGRGELYIIPRDGGAPRQLTRNGGSMRPFWSPDGRWIAYTRERGISIIPAAGGEPISVFPRGRELGGWSPDGRELYARMLNDTGVGTISAINIVTKQARPLVLFD